MWRKDKRLLLLKNKPLVQSGRLQRALLDFYAHFLVCFGRYKSRKEFADVGSPRTPLLPVICCFVNTCEALLVHAAPQETACGPEPSAQDRQGPQSVGY